MAGIWAENLEKRIISAGTKEEKLKLLTDAYKLTKVDADNIVATAVFSDDSVGRTARTDYNQLGERVVKTLMTVIKKLAIKHGLHEELTNYSFSSIPQAPKNCGSSPEQKPLEYLYCANVNVDTQKFCLNRGSLRCRGCFLVAYCSKLCQTEHWQKHKEICKSKLASPDWKPGWMLQQRLPNFFFDVCLRECVFNGHIWGNTPAFDLMRWQFNETKNLRDADVFDKPISMAFIDSGDFRNVIETLASVPENVSSPLHIVINDSNLVVSRNFLMLWALQDRGVDAIDAVLQVWYSRVLRQAQYFLLFNVLKASFREDVATFSDRPMVFRKNGGNTFSLNLYQANVVLKTLCGMSVANSLDTQAFVDERTKVLFDPRYKDQLEAYIFQLKPYHRLSWDCFRKFGVFMPFSAFGYHFELANKFIMNPESSAWPMTESADPMNGWDMRKVEKFAQINNLPKNDIIGCLYFYVRDRLLKALATLERLPVQIDFYCKDPKELSETLSSRVGLKLDRIDTGNLVDENCVGLSKLLLEWAPLLNKKNEYSVLITLFTNWFGKNNADLSENELLELAKNIGPEKIRQSLEECANGNICALRALQDESKDFEEFLEKKVQNLKKLKVAPRKEHRVVPHRLFAPIDAAENFIFRDVSDEENYFVSAIVRACSLRERYIEWILK